jgi:hypothetical protein
MRWENFHFLARDASFIPSNFSHVVGLPLVNPMRQTTHGYQFVLNSCSAMVEFITANGVRHVCADEHDVVNVISSFVKTRKNDMIKLRNTDPIPAS